MTAEQLLAFVQQGGAYCAPLLLLALGWLVREYRALQKDNKDKDQRLIDLSERLIAISTELKVFLYNERKA